MAGDSSPPELSAAREVVPGKGVLRRDVGKLVGLGPGLSGCGDLGSPCPQLGHSARTLQTGRPSQHPRQEAASTAGRCVRPQSSLCSAWGRPSLAQVVRCH